MKAPKCRLCGSVHWLTSPHVWSGASEHREVALIVDPEVMAEIDRRFDVSAGRDPAALSVVRESGGKFDRVAYQREYMRKRRAAKARK